MKLIKKGAEGDIYLSCWGKNEALFKTRLAKTYRNSILDFRIRKRRTIIESEIISYVKSLGINSPLIYFVDIKNCIIIMQYIPGELVKDLSDTQIINTCKSLGVIAGNLHKNGVMHGDLTTSNFILYDNKIFVIDFGLSSRTNKPIDHAIDLRLFKEILNSAHTSIMKNAWNNFLLGYKLTVGDKYHNIIMNLVLEIESRGRYNNNLNMQK